MKNLIKLKVILLAFTVIFASVSLSDDLILPSAKPSVDEKIKEITAKKKNIYPQKKPNSEKTEKKIESSEVTQESTEEIFIYPEKKPIIVKR